MKLQAQIVLLANSRKHIGKKYSQSYKKSSRKQKWRLTSFYDANITLLSKTDNTAIKLQLSILQKDKNILNKIVTNISYVRITKWALHQKCSSYLHPT